MRRLFVPFGDLTNGTETYPGGRYLDLERTATGVYDLDFNRAYHPFCVFNPPTTARFRRARTGCRSPIRAGERLRRITQVMIRRSSSTSTACSPTPSHCTCALPGGARAARRRR